MAAQWPLVAAQLVSVLPTLSGWTPDVVSVFDGAAFDVKTSIFATVGHATDGVNASSGNYSKQLYGDGFEFSETGSVSCQLASGKDGDLAAIRNELFGLFDPLEAYIRANRRLGNVLSAEGTCGLTVDLSSAQAITIANYAITFSIDYFTVT